MSDLPPVQSKGEGAANPLASTFHEPSRILPDRPLREAPRAAVCHWHSFVRSGADPFDVSTTIRPGVGGDGPMTAARLKAHADAQLRSRRNIGNYVGEMWESLS